MGGVEREPECRSVFVAIPRCAPSSDLLSFSRKEPVDERSVVARKVPHFRGEQHLEDGWMLMTEQQILPLASIPYPLGYLSWRPNASSVKVWFSFTSNPLYVNH